MPTDILPLVAPEIESSGEGNILAHDGWVSEFRAFQYSDKERNVGSPKDVPIKARAGRLERSTAVSRRSAPCGGDTADIPSKTMDNLRAEIKLLHWHKLANEAALKAALLKTKKLKSHSGGTMRPVPAMTAFAMPAERAAWMQQIIEEEQSKPLHVTKHFIKEYEEREKQNESRLETEVAAHIRSLRALRKQIEKRGEMTQRRLKYRATQRELAPKKQSLLLGKIRETGDGRVARTEGEGNRSDAHRQPLKGPQRQRTAGALDTVLRSLQKLVELEKRITSLERSNVYDEFRASKRGGAASAASAASVAMDLSVQPSRKRRAPTCVGSDAAPRPREPGKPAAPRPREPGKPAAGARTRRLSFSKQKTDATADAPSQVYYSVRVRRKEETQAASSKPQNMRDKWNQGVRNVVTQRPKAGVTARSRQRPSTFLTQLPDIHNKARTVERRPAGWGCCGSAVSGGKSGGGFRGAGVEKKRLEAKRKAARDRAKTLRTARQDQVISEWIQRKKAALVSDARYRTPSVRSKSAMACAIDARTRNRVGGVSTSRAVPNAHLQEFRVIRAGYAKRTERLRRDLSRSKQAAREKLTFLAGTRTTERPRPTPPAPTFARRPKTYRSRLDASARDVKPKMMNDRFQRLRRAHQGGACAVGGTGLRAARARQHEIVSSAANDSAINRGWSQPKNATGMLPTVRGLGYRRAVGGMSMRTGRQ